MPAAGGLPRHGTCSRVERSSVIVVGVVIGRIPCGLAYVPRRGVAPCRRSTRRYTSIATKESRAMLAVRLPADIERRLDALAKATGRTKTFYVREAILEHLEDLEDLYLAERELKAVRAGKSKTISLEKLMKQYG